MLEDIKKIQGINHNEFDEMITIWIQAAQNDLESIGIVNTQENQDSLVKTAIIEFVLSYLDASYSDLHDKSYRLLKDQLRHTTEYITESIESR